jgi:hypothetical protein
MGRGDYAGNNLLYFTLLLMKKDLNTSLLVASHMMTFMLAIGIPPLTKELGGLITTVAILQAIMILLLIFHPKWRT